jgi:hypothetical protein
MTTEIISIQSDPISSDDSSKILVVTLSASKTITGCKAIFSLKDQSIIHRFFGSAKNSGGPYMDVNYGEASGITSLTPNGAWSLELKGKIDGQEVTISSPAGQVVNVLNQYIESISPAAVKVSERSGEFICKVSRAREDLLGYTAQFTPVNSSGDPDHFANAMVDSHDIRNKTAIIKSTLLLDDDDVGSWRLKLSGHGGSSTVESQPGTEIAVKKKRRPAQPASPPKAVTKGPAQVTKSSDASN